MRELVITVIGLALSAVGALGVLWPGSGPKAGRMMRALQILAGLAVLITGIAFVFHGMTGMPK